jgi:hypothetical protein
MTLAVQRDMVLSKQILYVPVKGATKLTLPSCALR